jgi:hypothetical protein
VKDDRFTLGEPFEKILKNKNLYLNIVILKKLEIEFFFDKMRETFSDVDISHLKKGKTISGEDIKRAAIEISHYASAFYSAVTGFFDSLAIFHTKNREEVYRKIHFNNWLEDQIKRNPDNYLKYLEEQNENWIKNFRKDRNKFIHYWHPFLSMKELQRGEVKGGSFKIETYRTELEEGVKELIPYCKKIVSKLRKLVDEADKPENIKREYEFKDK